DDVVGEKIIAGGNENHREEARSHKNSSCADNGQHAKELIGEETSSGNVEQDENAISTAQEDHDASNQHLPEGAGAPAPEGPSRRPNKVPQIYAVQT
ncbi:unnamed protein product, partial [Amoebophrya sp. A120]